MKIFIRFIFWGEGKKGGGKTSIHRETVNRKNVCNASSTKNDLSYELYHSLEYKKVTAI